MATMYQEIAHASRLLRNDKIARQNMQTTGQISPQAKKDIKSFLALAKKHFQIINNVKNFYIKSFFYDICKEELILYCRVMGNDIGIKARPVTPIKYEFANMSGGKVSYNIRRLLNAVLAYSIPAENSTFNHKAINLMPAWRQ